MRKTLLLLLLLFVSFVPVSAQFREAFVDMPEGFKTARAIEPDGTHTLLVLFPDKYLGTRKKFEEGIVVGLPIVVGCSWFKDCKAEIGGMLTPETEPAHLFVDSTAGPSVRLLVFVLGNDTGEKIVGVLLKAVPVPKEMVLIGGAK